MRRIARPAFYGILLGLATAAVAEAVRPRGGTAVLLDWEDVRHMARARLDDPTLDADTLTAATKSYRSLARDLEKALLDFVGPLPKGRTMPRFDALDRQGWLDLNLDILRRVVDSVTKKGPAFTRFAAFAGVLPAQWRVMRDVQGTMSVVEGYSNLVMNQLGA